MSVMAEAAKKARTNTMDRFEHEKCIQYCRSTPRLAGRMDQNNKIDMKQRCESQLNAFDSILLCTNIELWLLRGVSHLKCAVKLRQKKRFGFRSMYKIKDEEKVWRTHGLFVSVSCVYHVCM